MKARETLYRLCWESVAEKLLVQAVRKMSPLLVCIREEAFLPGEVWQSIIRSQGPDLRFGAHKYFFRYL